MNQNKQICFGVIGFGHWGPNYVRNFGLLKDVKVKTVCEIDEGRLKILKDMFPDIHPTKDYQVILNDTEIECVVVATPASSHYPLIKEALLAQKDVLAEKPLCISSEEAKELQNLSEKQNRILMVGHVFRFNKGIQKLKEYIEEDFIGKIFYIHITHTNLGPIRSDVNVAWDLAPHDISILFHILGKWPLELNANGVSIFDNEREDFAFVSLKYSGNLLVHIHLSWIEPKKIRQMVIVGGKKMIIWNDHPTNPIEIHEKWVDKEPFYKDFGEFQLIPKQGSILVPRVILTEPLRSLCINFLKSVRERKTPFVNAEEGVKNTTVIEAINKSIKSRGGSVAINY